MQSGYIISRELELTTKIRQIVPRHDKLETAIFHILKVLKGYYIRKNIFPTSSI